MYGSCPLYRSEESAPKVSNSIFESPYVYKDHMGHMLIECEPFLLQIISNISAVNQTEHSNANILNI